MWSHNIIWYLFSDCAHYYWEHDAEEKTLIWNYFLFNEWIAISLADGYNTHILSGLLILYDKIMQFKYSRNNIEDYYSHPMCHS